MSPAGDLGQVLLAILEHRVVGAIGVRLQITFVALQELFRSLPTVIARVVVNDVGTVTIPHIRPDPAGARAGSLSIQHRHWRIVGLYGFRRQHHFLHAFPHRTD